MYNFQQLERLNRSDSPINEFFRIELNRDTNNTQIINKDFIFPDLVGFSTFKFVIPGKTFYSCLRCANCCKAIHAIDDKIVDGQCKRLKEDSCTNYHDRYTACKTFPFHVAVSTKGTDVLMIDSTCSGYNKGEVINILKYSELINQLNMIYSDNDGVHIQFMKKSQLLMEV